MSLGFGPNTVMNGLILNLDAANFRSYPASGSTSWKDLSSTKNTATINGSPSYNSTYGGYISFNGTTSQYAQVSNALPYNFGSGLFTLECWAAVTSNALYGRFFEHTFTNGFALMIDTGTSAGQLAFEVNGNSTRTVYNPPSSYIDSAWRQYVAVRTGSTTASLYVNGVNVSNGNIVGGNFASTDPLQINSSSYPLGCNIAVARVYNRALSATEILQNYNATKRRFGA